MPKCGEATSVAWVVAPEHPSSIAGCMRHGMLYAAESHLVSEGSYAKVFCSSGTTAGKSTAMRGAEVIRQPAAETFAVPPASGKRGSCQRSA